MVEEEPGQPRERTTDPREATGKLSHITTFAESWTRTYADSGEMAVVRNGQRFRPLGHSGPLRLNMTHSRKYRLNMILVVNADLMPSGKYRLNMTHSCKYTRC